MNVQRADFVVVDNRAQSGAGKRHFGIWILSLQIIDVQGGSQRVLSEIGKPKQSGECNASHAAAKRALLRVKAVRPDALVTKKMKRFVFVGVVGFLKNGDIVRAAFVQIAVFVCIYRIDFQSDHAEILPRELAGFANVFDVALSAAFAGEKKDLLHSALCDDLHFVFYLFHAQLHAADFVVAVKAAVDTVIFAVIRDVQRCEHIYRVSEVLARFKTRPLCHLFQKRFGGRGKEGFEILNRAGFMFKRGFNILCSVLCVVVGLHLRDDVLTHVGFNNLHSFHIFHMV